MNYKFRQYCKELNVKSLDDLVKYSTAEALRIPGYGRVTVKRVLMGLLEEKLGKDWMEVLWAAVIDEVFEGKASSSWRV